MTDHDSIPNKDNTFFINFLGEQAEYETPVRDDSMWNRNSVFSEHLLQTEDPQMEIKSIEPGYQTPGWFFVIFIFQLLLLGIVFTVFYNSIRLQLSSVFSGNNMEQLVKQNSPVLQTDTVLMLLVFVLSMSMVAFTAIRIYLPATGLPDLTLFGILLLIFGGLPVAKLIIFGFIGAISGDGLANSLYIANMLVYDILIGLIAFPFAVIIIFHQFESLYFLVIALAFTLFVIRGIRGIALSFQQSPFKSLYIILYLCTFEILPILALVIRGLRITEQMG